MTVTLKDVLLIYPQNRGMNLHISMSTVVFLHPFQSTLKGHDHDFGQISFFYFDCVQSFSF